MKTLSVLRWIAGGIVFAAAAVVFGQMASESRVSPVPSHLAGRLGVARLTTAEAPQYAAVVAGDPEVRTAVDFALADQRRKNRSAVKLISVLGAERQYASGSNVRVCLSVDRHGRTDSARVVVHRSEKDQWSVTLWAWGACPSAKIGPDRAGAIETDRSTKAGARSSTTPEAGK
jgi:hypothetical protein